MRRIVSIFAILLMAAAAAPRLQAQTAHAAPLSVLDVAVQQHVDTTAADREAVLRVLRNADVKAVAERAGIDLRRANSAVSTLHGDDLARVAAQARQVENALAGGATQAQWWAFVHTWHRDHSTDPARRRVDLSRV